MKHANEGKCNPFSAWKIKAKIYYFNDKSRRKQRKKELVQQHKKINVCIWEVSILTNYVDGFPWCELQESISCLYQGYWWRCGLLGFKTNNDKKAEKSWALGEVQRAACNMGGSPMLFLSRWHSQENPATAKLHLNSLKNQLCSENWDLVCASADFSSTYKKI